MNQESKKKSMRHGINKRVWHSLTIIYTVVLEIEPRARIPNFQVIESTTIANVKVGFGLFVCLFV